MPVLVAVGEITERNTSGNGSTPVQLMASACQAAEKDAEVLGLLDSVSHMAATGLTVDAEQVKIPLSNAYKNVPHTVANLLGIKPSHFYYAATGGNTPQYLVNHFAEAISLGQCESVLLTGGEALATMLAKFDRWYKWFLPKGEWQDNPGTLPMLIGDSRSACNVHEHRHGLDLPANVYPLFENALQHHYGRTREVHRQKLGELYADLSHVAAGNEFAWFQNTSSESELVDASTKNRMVAYPYTKKLNSMIVVNQAAAVVLTSVAKAKQLGIAEHKWVYLHGCAQAHDIWNVSERIDFHSSPALQRCADEAFSMAGKCIDDIRYFDIYSCFPSAVQIACDAFGISHNDSRGLTLTGGLPYFGGPGNNYSMHAIVSMVRALRKNSGSYGLLNAVGWFLTKHALGVYACEPMEKQWRRSASDIYQDEILSQTGPKLVHNPCGKAQIETFTVLFSHKRTPVRAIVVGRLESGERFLANTPDDQDVMLELCRGDSIGRFGNTSSCNGNNTFNLT